jgi:hypothetical protein
MTDFQIASKQVEELSARVSRNLDNITEESLSSKRLSLSNSN